MSCSPAIVVPLPGVEGYRLVELEIAQQARPRDSLSYSIRNPGRWDGRCPKWRKKPISWGCSAHASVRQQDVRSVLGITAFSPTYDCSSRAYGEVHIVGWGERGEPQQSTFRVGHYCVQPNRPLPRIYDWAHQGVARTRQSMETACGSPVVRDITRTFVFRHG